MDLKNSFPGQLFQLTQIPFNFKTSYYNLKIRGVGAKPCLAFLLF